jgi:acetyl esterase
VPLDPVTAQINDLVQAARATAPPMTPELVRQGYAQFIELVGTTTTSSKVEPIDVGGLDSLLFTPPEHDDALLVWFHGGGWVINAPGTSINEVDRLAVAARCRAVSVGYRLAPEHPMPTPQLDAVAATQWCVAHAEELGVDPTRVSVGGDSAGGNLAAVAAQRVGGLAAQLLVYPACDLRPETNDQHPHPEGYFLDKAAVDFFFACAVGDVDRADPLVSPALADASVLAAVPAALVITAEFDPLRDQGRTYAAALVAHGVHVEELRFDDQMHGFFTMPEALAGARAAIEASAAFLQRQSLPR